MQRSTPPHWTQVAGLALVLATGLLAIWARLGLVGDGAYFLARTLVSGSLPDVNVVRTYVLTVTNLPLLIAVRGGVTNPELAAVIHSAGAVGVPTLVWFSAACILRTGSLFWPMMAAWGIVYLNSGFFAHGEYNTAHALVALMAALLLKPGPIVRRDVLVLCGSAVVLYESYESVVFLGPLLACCAAFRLGVVGRESPPTDRRVLQGLVLFVALVAATSLHAGWAIVSLDNPSNPDNRSEALRWSVNVQQYQFVVSALVGAAVVVELLARRGVVLIVLAVAVAVAGIFTGDAGMLSPIAHYRLRVPTALALLMLLAAMAFSRFTGTRSGWLAGSGRVILPLSLVLAASFMLRAVQFRRFTAEVTTVVRARTGVVAWEDTGIDGSLMLWPWATSTLSLVLGAAPHNAVLLPPRSYVGWQPFDARQSIPWDPRRATGTLSP